jgi:hypothetical protein
LSSPAAIRGTFSDFRLIKGRKCAQIICEIPIEEADAALSVLGGIPQPASERWIALAPLNITSIKPQQKQRWDDLKLAAQASIRCGEPAFWAFLREGLAEDVSSETHAAHVVRRRCGVESRSALNLDSKAAAKWRELERAFQVWMREPQHA